MLGLTTNPDTIRRFFRGFVVLIVTENEPEAYNADHVVFKSEKGFASAMGNPTEICAFSRNDAVVRFPDKPRI
jgi:ABC-type sulfate/molybdate transport systems ATPase subunit